MIFGAPIVMNPVLGIPFIVAPLVTTTISYVALGKWFSANDGRTVAFRDTSAICGLDEYQLGVAAGVLVVFNFFITLAIYYPFFQSI